MAPSPSHQEAGPLPAGRTGHACAQCRHRKQKCGGFTVAVRCRPCSSRRVTCSFESEVRDLRHNPYFHIKTPSSPSVSVETASTSNDNLGGLSPGLAALIPALSAADRGDSQGPTGMAGAGADASSSSRSQELPEQVQELKSRIANLERRLEISQRDGRQYLQESSSTRASTYYRPPNYNSSQQGYPSPQLLSPMASFPTSASYSLSGSRDADMTEGPLKTLNRLQTDDPIESEMQDPILRQILTEGEAHVIFRLFFSHGHPNAPFLDTDWDSDSERVRSRSILLFLAILSIGARFWGASSKISCWLHPRYTELVRLLDAEIVRVTLRPTQKDHKLETVQALTLYAHWMPLDLSAGRERYRSRFSEASAWHCLGLAIRWATSLELERSCCLSFQRPEAVTRTDARKFRTMLYLIESDHYLALSARCPSNFDTKPLSQAIDNFIRCQYVQSTDMRLTFLFQVAHSTHSTGCRPTTIESVEAFNRDVQLVENRFTSLQGDLSMDAMSPHFPFTSLRWYRLSYTCAFLGNADQSQWTRKALMWAVECASQILIHLSKPSLSESPDTADNLMRLEPDPDTVDIMSFAIDHYYVVVAYAAFVLVNSWLKSFVDLNIRPLSLQSAAESDMIDQEPCTSLLFRLVDVAARTLEAASPPEGHLARRYVPLLRGMMDMILSDNVPSQSGIHANTGLAMKQGNQTPEQLQSHLGEDLWDMWHQAGLEPMSWPSLLDNLTQVE